MKRKMIFLIGCVLLTVQSIAQTENFQKDLPKERKQSAINKELRNNSLQPIGVDTMLFSPKLKGAKSAIDTTIVSKLNIQLPPHYGNKVIFPFHKKMFFYLENEQKQYLNLASYNLIYSALGFRCNNKLDLTGGLLIMKQFTNRSPHAIGRSGTRFNLNYSITNQLDFNIWGQYLTGSIFNSPTDAMLPQTGAGASMVLNLGGGSQFGIDTKCQYDDKEKKWNYNSGGKLKLNF